MPFNKLVKNKAYFKRYQVKFRRRREGKTDFFARKRLILQDKNKYNSPKYRFIVRFTNRDVICQLAYAKLEGDHTICHAYSHELPRYGVTVGLKNYAAAYCTGLLLARRHLHNLGLETNFPGNTEDPGKIYRVGFGEEDGRRPFKALLDVGLRRTTTGAKLFAAMKGAVDGGLNIPHSCRRYIGSRGNRANQETLRHYLTGGHVKDWMEELQERGDGAYEKHFKAYIRAGVGPDDLEDMYLGAHKAIRADPSHKSSAKPKPEDFVQKRWTPKKRSYAQRRDRIRQILASQAAEDD